MVEIRPVLEAARAALHGRGERMTAARGAVLRALVEADERVTAEELAVLVAEASPGVHRSSVYRSLEALCGVGVVVHTHLGHGATVYHLPERPSLFAQCRHCGVIVEVDEAVLSPAREAFAREHGFALDLGHVALSGTCAACR